MRRSANFSAMAAASAVLLLSYSPAYADITEGIFREVTKSACYGSSPTLATMYVVRKDDGGFSGRIEFIFKEKPFRVLLLGSGIVDGKEKLFAKSWASPYSQEDLPKININWIAGSYLITITAKDWRCLSADYIPNGTSRREALLAEQTKYDDADRRRCAASASNYETSDLEVATNFAAAASICQTENFTYLTKIGQSQIFEINGDMCKSSLFGMHLRTHRFQNRVTNCKTIDNEVECNSNVYMFCKSTGSERDLNDCNKFNLMFDAAVKYKYDKIACTWKSTSFQPLFGTVQQNPNAR
ncbi:hypothetical protein [Methylobacterium sp. 22177]|uniref:hypothetical protein n=1 Tax=Methylobacterium sp. 22177 TaxID=3453885 RepID=UPI003F86A03E